MQVTSWGRILAYVAGAGGKIDPNDLFVIANALEDLGGHLHDDAEALCEQANISL